MSRLLHVLFMIMSMCLSCLLCGGLRFHIPETQITIDHEQIGIEIGGGGVGIASSSHFTNYSGIGNSWLLEDETAATDLNVLSRSSSQQVASSEDLNTRSRSSFQQVASSEESLLRAGDPPGWEKEGRKMECRASWGTGEAVGFDITVRFDWPHSRWIIDEVYSYGSYQQRNSISAARKLVDMAEGDYAGRTSSVQGTPTPMPKIIQYNTVINEATKQAMETAQSVKADRLGVRVIDPSSAPQVYNSFFLPKGLGDLTLRILTKFDLPAHLRAQVALIKTYAVNCQFFVQVEDITQVSPSEEVSESRGPPFGWLRENLARFQHNVRKILQ